MFKIEVLVMYPDQQRRGFNLVVDALHGEFHEDSIVLWNTIYLAEIIIYSLIFGKFNDLPLYLLMVCIVFVQCR